MKKITNLFILLLAVVSVLTTSVEKTIAQTPYGIFDEKTGTLTLGYAQTLPEGAKVANANGSGFKFIGSNITNADNVKKVIFDNSFADFKPTTCAYWFSSCSNLTEIQYIGNLKTDNVTDMSNMFYECKSLTSLDVSNFKTDNVTDMSNMFSMCNNLTSLDLSNFKTDNVTDMSMMFPACSSLTSLDVSNFKTDNVTDMSAMFYGCSSLTSLDVSNFKTDNVTNMVWMFNNCSSLSSLDLSNFKTDNVTSMGAMFNNCSSLTSLNVSSFNTENVTNMMYMFYGCSSLTSLDVSNFKTDNVTSIYWMFSGCSRLTSLDVSNFKTDNVTDMSNMFSWCWGLTSLDVSSFKTDNVTNMSNMFSGCGSLTSLDVSNFKTDNVTDMSEMFNACYVVTSLDVSGFDTKNVTNMRGMFSCCNVVTSLDVSGFDTKNVTDMSLMFNGCIAITELDVSGFDTKNVTSMESMFASTSLTSLDVSSFDTRNVKNMENMFWWCKNITTLDISSFDTRKVTNMSEMFSNCDALKTIYVGDNWNTNAVSVYSSKSMFNHCYCLYGEQGTKFSLKNIDKVYAHIDGGKENPGYLTKIGNKPFVPKEYTVLENGTLTFYYGDEKPKNKEIYYIREYNNIGTEIKKVVFDESFKAYKPQSCRYWFHNLINLSEIIGMSEYLQTEDVTDMRTMFYNCSSLSSLDLSSFKTDNVTDMDGMFSKCNSLTSLDLSNFKTDNVTDMSYMFSGCDVLKTIYVGDNWNTDAVTSSNYMFYNCSNLYGGKGTKYDSEKTDKTYARIDDGEANPGYFTEKATISIKTLPTKTQYFEGEDIDLSGGKILLSYKISEDEIIDMTDEKFSASKNNNTIEIFYNGEKIEEFDITIKAVEVEKIELTTLPEKLEYFEGENFSAKGGVLKISYNNGEKKTLDLSTEEVKISGFDKTKVGKQTLKVEAFGKETTFEVSVKAKTAISISITTSPKKTEYIKGEKLDVSEGEITIKYDNGEEKIAELSETKISGFDRNKVGKQTLTVEYQGLTTTFDVKVEQENIVPKPENPETAIDDISVNSNVKIWSNEKTIFIENGGKEIQIFDMSGRIIKTIKSDCTRVEIPMSKGGIYIVKTNSKTQKVIVK